MIDLFSSLVEDEQLFSYLSYEHQMIYFKKSFYKT